MHNSLGDQKTAAGLQGLLLEHFVADVERRVVGKFLVLLAKSVAQRRSALERVVGFE